MAQAARRVEQEAPPRRGARLSVVPPARPRQPASRRPVRAAAREARARSIFMSVVTLAVVLVAVGLLRIAVVARATEMMLAESTLAASIKTQRIETDRLEVDRNSLATPSRIEEIAGATMGMGRPASVRYITMPAYAPTRAAGAAGAEKTGGAPGGAPEAASAAFAAVVGALADMSAIEAQALLVGDVGLAGAR